MKQTIKTRMMMAFVLCLVFIAGVLPFNAMADAAVLQPDVPAPSAGNLFADVAGVFLSCGSEKALRQLNTYRYQACYYGDKDPRNTSRKLALSDRSGGENPSDEVLQKPNGDYVPATWSYDLECIAELRAVEACIYPSHTRPNGKSCFTASCNGTRSSEECLAWGRSMLGGMQQWYGERSIWVNGGSGETGHYTAMIDPSFVSFGVAAFQDYGGSYVMTVLEGRRSAASNQSCSGRNGSFVQRIEVAGNAVTGIAVDGEDTMLVGGTQSMSVNANLQYTDAFTRKSSLPIASEIVWASSDSAIAPIDQNGRLSALKTGTAMISATVLNRTVSMTVTIDSKQYYTITFDARLGKSEVYEMTVEAGNTIGILPNATRTDYTLDGWFRQPEGGTKVTENWTPTGSVRLYAHWSKAAEIYYTVTLDPNGGVCNVETMRFSANDVYHDMPIPTRAGYRFNGWYTEKEGGTLCDRYYGISSDRTVYAQWTADARTYYTIDFDANGGYCETEKVSVPEDEHIGTLPKAVRAGYVFEGWSTSRDTRAIVSSAWQPTEDGTLYAKWRKTSDIFTVTLDANGGTCPESERIYAYNQGLGVLPIPTRTGYVFEGWSLSPDSKTFVTETRNVTSSFTLYAIWHEIQTFTIEYDVNGGNETFDARVLTEGDSIGTLPTPTRERHEFRGWYRSKTNGVRLTEDWKPTQSCTIYARWEKKRYLFTITFDPQGGEVNPAQKQVWEDDAIGEMPVPTRKNREFYGWYPNDWGGLRIETWTVPTGDMTVYASWKLIKPEYTVRFNANGGSTSIESITVVDGETVGTLPTATRSGYIFDGWYTERTGGTKLTESWIPTASATAYAHWTAEPTPAPTETPKPTETPTPTETPKPTETPEPQVIAAKIEWNAEDVLFKGTTPYVIANGKAQTPRFTVKDEKGSVIDAANYTFEYRENTDAGTGYVIVTFRGAYSGTTQGWFKIYLPATETTSVENQTEGIYLKWNPVPGAEGYVIYRRAWSSTTNGWTAFLRWDNTTGTSYTDGKDANHKVYAGTRYQYGVKAYFARRTDPISGTVIGGNVGDNYNLGEVGPLKTTVRITTRELVQLRPGNREMTVKWSPSKIFTGYQIQYAADAKFTRDAGDMKIDDPSTCRTTIKGLKPGMTYYVRIRSYHVFEGMTYFGEWSNVLDVKVR